MREKLEHLIEEFRAYVRAALQHDEWEHAQFLVRIIVGFQICIRLLAGPERCLYPPPSFESGR